MASNGRPRRREWLLAPMVFLASLGWHSNPAVAQLSTTGALRFEQQTPFVPDVSEDGDRFGSALASCDFDFDGHLDLAIGVPREDLIAGDLAGQVTIIYGSPSGLEPQTTNDAWFGQSLGLIADDAEPGDLFGTALAAGYFNDDPFCDLAIGVPGEDLIVEGIPIANAGAVSVIYGSIDGLTQIGDQFFSQDTAFLNGVPEEGDRFGAALAAGDWNGDRFDDLAIGVPGESVFANGVDHPGAGAVNILYSSGLGLSPALAPVPDQILTEASFGDEVEADSAFGRALATGNFNPSFIFSDAEDLVIGAPFETVGAGDEAGAIFVAYGVTGGALSTANGQRFTQDSSGLSVGDAEGIDRFGWALASGDFDGDGASDLAVGSPFETLTVDGVLQVDNGLVHILYGGVPGVGLSTADSRAIARSRVDSDFASPSLFGSSLATGNFNGDDLSDLAIGTFDAQVNGLAGAGVVYGLVAIANRSFDLSAAVRLSQAGPVPGVEDINDGFGRALAAGDWSGDGLDDLAVGVPVDDSGAISAAGAINLFFGQPPFVLPIQPR